MTLQGNSFEPQGIHLEVQGISRGLPWDNLSIKRNSFSEQRKGIIKESLRVMSPLELESRANLKEQIFKFL